MIWLRIIIALYFAAAGALVYLSGSGRISFDVGEGLFIGLVVLVGFPIAVWAAVTRKRGH